MGFKIFTVKLDSKDVLTRTSLIGKSEPVMAYVRREYLEETFNLSLSSEDVYD